MSIFLPIKKSIIRSAFKKKMKNKPDFAEADSFVLPIDADENQNNSYFFGGYDVINHRSIVLRLGIRNPDLKEVFVFVLEGDAFLVTPLDYYNSKNCPLSIEMIESTKKWKVIFDGKLLDKNNNKMVDVMFDFIFEANQPMYDFFFSHLNESMVTSVASPKWNKDFKKSNHSNNQRHLEQPGVLTGNMTIAKKSYSFSMPGGRDRSFGKRIWNEMYDHIWLFAYNEKGEAFNFSLVNYPLMKNLRSGWTTIDSNEIISIASSSLLDYQYLDGLGSDVLSLQVKLTNGKILNVTSNREFFHQTNYQNGQYFFQEGLGEFTINDKKFYGSIEYGFNIDKSKWSPIIK